MKDLTSPSYISENIRKSGFFFKKNLGQNFLKESSVARKIVDSLELTGEECVLEIGPGFGALTGFLCGKAGKVIAVEIDHFAAGVLREALEDEANLEIVEQDALKTDLLSLLYGREESYGAYKAVSNLPYNITSPLIMRLLDIRPRLSSIVLMVQREVADRLAAPAGGKDYSSFTAQVRFLAECEKLFDVSKNSFMPVPGVDSAVMRLTPRETPPVSVKSETMMAEMIKASFSMRRKTLANCLSSYFRVDRGTASDLIVSAGIAPSARGETLDLADFARLADAFHDAGIKR